MSLSCRYEYVYTRYYVKLRVGRCSIVLRQFTATWALTVATLFVSLVSLIQETAETVSDSVEILEAYVWYSVNFSVF